MALVALKQFFKFESAGGILLVFAAALAIVAANSPAADLYQAFLATRMEVRIADLEIAKPLILWINDGLMAIFFFLVGLEIKREVKEGELADRSSALLPAVAALGGMAVPALIYVAVNFGAPENLGGWAIPAATDIAFALGILALLGSRVPLSLKVLLTAIAILDDLGAITIIALFYTEDLSLASLALSGAALALLVVLNVCGVRRLASYVIIGIVLWVLVLKSGVHATLAGVALAMTIPLSPASDGAASPLKSLEHDLHPFVAFGVLPLFAFANAGVSFKGFGFNSLFEPITLGIALGLFIGKQIGIFASLRLAIRTGLATMPAGCTWGSLYGLSLLCGVGFTMSLFIGGLAWEHNHYDAAVRLGVLSGSILSALVGLAVLLVVLPKATALRDTALEVAGPNPQADRDRPPE